MNIFVTGMSGVGKSTLCNYLKQLKYNAFDLDDIPGLCELYHPNGERVRADEKRTELNMLETDYLCDTKALSEHIGSHKGQTFYFGYVDNFSEVARKFEQIILLTVTPEENKRRMSIRTTTDFAKDEKTQNELLAFKDEWESLVRKHNAIVIDASKDTAELANKMLGVLDIETNN